MSDAITTLALIGFGEAGGILGSGWQASGRYRVKAYDILLDDPAAAAAMRERMRAAGVTACASLAQASEGAAIVVSAVTAAAAFDVADEAGRHLRAGQIFLDLNSVSPDTKRRNAQALERSGADYVEAAVMAPVPPAGLKVPMLLGGRRAADVVRLLEPAGMKLEVGEAEIGKASATKMCRSIMIKGLEALVVECFQSARAYGVEERVLASLKQTYPGIDWETQVGYLLGRVVQHGRRRAAEMREVAGTVAECGLEPLMASAIADRQQWLADVVAANPRLRESADPRWRDTFDEIARCADVSGGIAPPRGAGT